MAAAGAVAGSVRGQVTPQHQGGTHGVSASAPTSHRVAGRRAHRLRRLQTYLRSTPTPASGSPCQLPAPLPQSLQLWLPGHPRWLLNRFNSGRPIRGTASQSPLPRRSPPGLAVAPRLGSSPSLLSGWDLGAHLVIRMWRGEAAVSVRVSTRLTKTQTKSRAACRASAHHQQEQVTAIISSHARTAHNHSAQNSKRGIPDSTN